MVDHLREYLGPESGHTEYMIQSLRRSSFVHHGEMDKYFGA